MIARVSDQAIHAAVASGLRWIVLDPDHDAAHATTTMVQLIGLSEYAAGRGTDPTDGRHRALADAISSLHDNRLVLAQPSGSPWEVAAAVLAHAAGQHDDHARQAQRVLRPLLVAQLDDELATTVQLIDAFRGKVRAVDAD